MEKYIGVGVHATSCTAAVVNAQGKKLGSHVIATSGVALVEFLKTQAGTIHLCIEEGGSRLCGERTNRFSMSERLRAKSKLGRFTYCDLDSTRKTANERPTSDRIRAHARDPS